MKHILLSIFGSILLVSAQAQNDSSIMDDPAPYLMKLDPTTNLSRKWINDDSLPLLEFPNAKLRPILVRWRQDKDLSYGCGFYCNELCEIYLFAIYPLPSSDQDRYELPQVFWSANRNNPVKLNATLQLTSEGDLVLRDADGTLAWSTNTLRKGVAGLNMTESGNLVLFGVNNSVVWQSFDHPTDTLLHGQNLVAGQKLTASVSETNWMQGQFFISFVYQSLAAFVGSNRPQVYAQFFMIENNASHVIWNNTGLNYNNFNVSFVEASSSQFIRLDPDGHLKLYDFVAFDWKVVSDLTDGVIRGRCNYPTVCGINGICSEEQCSCPISRSDSTNYFKPINDRHPNLGCASVTELTCNDSRYHDFVDLENVTYFTFVQDFRQTNVHHCKEACLRNCSCKAALFRYNEDPSKGECFLPSEIFSLINVDREESYYNTSVHIKVQRTPSANEVQITSSAKSQHTNSKLIVSKLVVAVLSLFLVAFITALTVYIKRKIQNGNEAEEDYLDHVPGMPSRLSYEELKFATDNFSKKLGQGGFGSVFEGTLKDGTKVAVKCLDGVGQVKQSFLAEVESIGSIHHVNLVRLVGFSAEKSNRLLVYEYMPKGSLDTWIYHKIPDVILDWRCRGKIIHDVAKGLAYLHEDCRQKIIHLDIKPQNILLDENFNAKLSDFGLSKLIDRDQSQVITTMRGTPGYLAPEWLSAVITEKVDVYSFGIVILEILCGRKIFELSELEEDRHLLRVFKGKAEQKRMLDLVDKRSQDMQSHGKEVEEMMQLAAWCLLSDYSKRPSMSVVVKVLEGSIEVEKNIDYSSLNSQPSTHREQEDFVADATPLLASVLSAARTLDLGNEFRYYSTD